MTDSIETKRSIPTPWILGLYGLAGATFITAAHMAGWYGGPESARLLFPFAAVLGGAVPLLAAMWAFEARDALATAILGVWGSFWVGYGILNALFLTARLSAPQGRSPELSFWFIALAAITWAGAAMATTENAALTITLVILAAASTIRAIAEGFGVHGLALLAGWLFLIVAGAEWYTATAMMFDQTVGRQVLPIGYGQTAATPLRAATGPTAVRPAPPSQRSA
jgi:succinate-acetate transporter protein